MRSCTPGLLPRPARNPRRSLSIRAFLLVGALALLHASAAAAQGFGGKGGGGGHRGGGNRDAASTPCAPAAANPAGDALAGFLAALRGLRTELLIRADQSEAWTAMRDALLAYESAAATPAAASAAPLQRVKALADSAQERAATLAKFDAAMDSLVAVLDESQRRTLLDRLGGTLAAANSAPAR